MTLDDYILQIERHSHHDRDDWGVASDSYACYDAALAGLQAGDTVYPTEYRGEQLARRRDPQTYLECLQVEEERLTFRFHCLENYRGVEIAVGPEAPASVSGSTDRSHARYTISLIPKENYIPTSGYINYQ